MADPDHARLLGRLALHYKVADPDRLKDALNRYRQAGGEDFGAFLVGSGIIDQATRQKLEKARDVYLARRKPDGGDAPAPAERPNASSPTAVRIPEAAPPAAPSPEEQPNPARPAEEAELSFDDAASAALVSTDRTEAAAAAPEPAEAGSLAALLTEAARTGASDLHLHSGARLRTRIDGRLKVLGDRPIEAETAERLIHDLLDADQRQALAADQQVDLVFELPGVARFRGNVYRQQRGTDAVFRVIPLEPPSLADLGLPAELEAVINHHQGLVLFTGPAGCGKSSTMAAAIQLLSQSRAEHILTIEDPVELVFPERRALVNQRQVGPHTESFARALRAALREDPDVIVIGELRDLESISLALTAAETGHLVLATLHTTGAIRTINRLLGVFPPDEQPQVRTMLSESLRGIVSQQLVSKIGGGRVVALEILLNTPAIGNLIREAKTFQIRSVMQTSSGAGMCLLDASLAALVKAGTVSLQEARAYAEEPNKLEAAS